jgi:hypothetical protein
VVLAVASLVLLSPTEASGRQRGIALLHRGSGPRYDSLVTCHGKLVRKQAIAEACAATVICLSVVVLLERRRGSMARNSRRSVQIGLVGLAATVGGLIVAYSRYDPCETATYQTGRPRRLRAVHRRGGGAVLRHHRVRSCSRVGST